MRQPRRPSVPLPPGYGPSPGGAGGAGTAAGALLALWRALGLQRECSWPSRRRWDCSGSAPAFLEGTGTAGRAVLTNRITFCLQSSHFSRCELHCKCSASAFDKPKCIVIA